MTLQLVSIFVFGVLGLCFLPPVRRRLNIMRTGSTSNEKTDVEHTSNQNREQLEYVIYDVFISHRGPDTKLKLVSHLVGRLENLNYRVFVDTEGLEPGDRAWPKMQKVLRTATVQLIIESENYHSSWWCMEELRISTETPEKIIPVFFGVTPGMTKDKEKLLEKSFQKLRQRNSYTCSEDTILDWRKALDALADISGIEHDPHTEKEAALVTRVTRSILKAIPSAFSDSNLVGMDDLVEDLLGKVEQAKVTGCILVLWGMGGIGKTTAARELFRLLQPRFESTSCFVANVRERAEQREVPQMQQQILKELCDWNDVPLPSDVDAGSSLILTRVGDRKVLLVLDDVAKHGPNTVNYLLPIANRLSNGSVVVITTRDKDLVKLLPKAICVLIPIQKLPEDVDSFLFDRYAFPGEVDVPTNLLELRSDVIKACSGLPLTLKVLGVALRDNKEPDFWEEQLKNLAQGTDIYGTDDEKVFNRLQISYNALKGDGEISAPQEMFLDISCLLLGRSSSTARVIWSGRDNWTPRIYLDMLVDRCLVEIDEDGNLAMHDQLRDMGQKIERDTPRHKRLRFPLGAEEERRLYEKCVEGIYSISSEVLPSLFAKSKSLRMIIMDNDCVIFEVKQPMDMLYLSRRGSRTDGQDLFGNLHDFGKLRVLDLSESLLSALPDGISQLMNLIDLNLDGCGRVTALPKAISQLLSLKKLGLSRCQALTALPESFGNLLNLQKLDLSNCRCIKELSIDFAKLSSLEELDLSSCDKLMKLPEDFGMLLSLEKLNLFGCRELKELPGDFGKLLKLRELNMWGLCYLTELPESFENLSSLQILDLGNCRRLKVKDFACLTNLKELKTDAESVDWDDVNFNSFKLKGISDLVQQLKDPLERDNAILQLRFVVMAEVRICDELQPAFMAMVKDSAAIPTLVVSLLDSSTTGYFKGLAALTCSDLFWRMKEESWDCIANHKNSIPLLVDLVEKTSGENKAESNIKKGIASIFWCLLNYSNDNGRNLKDEFLKIDNIRNRLRTAIDGKGTNCSANWIGISQELRRV